MKVLYYIQLSASVISVLAVAFLLAVSLTRHAVAYSVMLTLLLVLVISMMAYSVKEVKGGGK